MEAINNIPVGELRAVNSQSLQKQCMGSFELPWMGHLEPDVREMTKDYFDQLYDAINDDWMDDPVCMLKDISSLSHILSH